MDIEEVFENLPNFRQAGGQKLMNRNGQMIKDGLLFRSSRTDFLEEKEKAIFQKLQIKAIIDLRRKTEYERAEGEKLLDDLYTPCVVEKGKMEEMKPSFRWGGKLRKRKTAQKDPDSTDAPCPGRRYLINMMTMDLIWYIFGQVNFFIRYLSLVLLLVDWLCGCHIFVKFFAWAVVNRMSLAQQYVDMLEYTKPAVADILRVIIEEDNVPVLIHCAHGKDRTGVIIGVILGCLEVDDDIIAEDYAKSEVRLWQDKAVPPGCYVVLRSVTSDYQ